MFYHYLGYSSFLYERPLHGYVQTYKDLGFLSPAHVGPFKHAEDIVIPDPRKYPLKILAPVTGIVAALVQENTAWGSTKAYVACLNYITVFVVDAKGRRSNEFYELAHIEAGSCPFKIGDFIKCGDYIATTGLNGWITSTGDQVDSHLHFMVGHLLKGNKFKSLRIRYKKAGM